MEEKVPTDLPLYSLLEKGRTHATWPIPLGGGWAEQRMPNGSMGFLMAHRPGLRPPTPPPALPLNTEPLHAFGIFQVEIRLKGPLWLHMFNTSCLWFHHP